MPGPAPRDHTRAAALGQGALAMAGLGAVLLGARALSIHAPACPFRSLTGVPCPGCGMTRLAAATASGHLATAVRADAAGVAILGAIVVLAAAHLVTVIWRKQDPPAWMRHAALPVALVALVAVHWVTTIITGGLPSSS